MNRQIRLLLCVKGVDGGTGTFVLSLLKLTRIFHNIKIAAIALEKPRYRKIKNNKFIFFKPARFFPNKYSLSLNNIFNFFHELFWLNYQIDKFHPDIILGVDTHANFLTIINKIFFLKKPKVILTVHIDTKGTLEEKATPILNLIISKLISLLYPRADAIVCVSKQLAKSLVHDLKVNKKISTIYNGIPTKKNKKKVQKKGQIIVFVGRLVKQKDCFTLLEAFYLLNKELPYARLWLVGDGPLKKDIKNFISKNNLSGKISLFGWKNNPSLYLKKANIFVLSSKREGLSYVILEAMSQGVPIISTNVSFGPAELLGNGKYGILVPIGNKPALKEALLKLLTNKQLYNFYAQKSYQRSFFFSEKKMLHQYTSLIDTLSSQQ